jgi:hypothetical protein
MWEYILDQDVHIVSFVVHKLLIVVATYRLRWTEEKSTK